MGIDPAGLFLIEKKAGPTSADVIRELGRQIGKKVKMGHAGTLDPDGTGLLVILVGDATKLSESIMDMPKTYEATVRFGIATDTYDAAGKVIEESDPSKITKEDIEKILPDFQGSIAQIGVQNASRMYSLISGRLRPEMFDFRNSFPTANRPATFSSSIRLAHFEDEAGQRVIRAQDGSFDQFYSPSEWNGCTMAGSVGSFSSSPPRLRRERSSLAMPIAICVSWWRVRIHWICNSSSLTLGGTTQASSSSAMWVP